MSSSAALLEKVPQHWASLVRPFLQRSREFEDKEPLVAYFLRTHVAFLCMKQRKKEDKAGTAFLLSLLEALEADKARLAGQLEGVDGRTTLTRFALMLFARADDAERTGNASLTLVRIFYTSAVLFEATEQFTDDGAMDNIAAQKCKYAKYIATRMKKALDAGESYVSPNKIEPFEGGPEAGDIGGNTNFTTAPASCFARPTSNPASAVKPGDAAVPMPPLQPPPSPASKPYAYTTNNSSSSPNSNATPAVLPPLRQDPPPPAYSYDSGSSNSSTPNPSAHKALPAVPQHRPSISSNSNMAPLPPPPQQQQQPMPSHPSPIVAAPPANTNFKPSVDQMIDAQKFASRAVSALQFYDYENAKSQLVAALRILNGASA